MGIRFRKSVKIAPGIKANLNKKSAGVTFGTRGAHYTVNSSGKHTSSVGIPGTGVSYVSSKGGGDHSSHNTYYSDDDYEYNELDEPTYSGSYTFNSYVPDDAYVSKKSKTIDLILCIFLGLGGFHKFYEGKVLWGIIYFCTMGLFYIGWIHDIYIIATGQATDSHGKPITF